jgi:hypothetical protein
VEGNLCAKRRVNYTRDLLEEIGIEKERLRMVNISAAMARPLADTITDMVETIRKLGPNPLRKSNGNPEGGVPRRPIFTEGNEGNGDFSLNPQPSTFNHLL